MCKICDNSYEKLEELEVLHIHNCNIITIIPNINNKRRIHIMNCPNITEIPNVIDLQVLEVVNCPGITKIPNIINLRCLDVNNCQNIKQIPNIVNLHILEITNCQNIQEIPNIQNLHNLNIYNCHEITKIPNLLNLQELKIKNCTHFIDNIEFFYHFGYNSQKINKFYKINQIKQWWKKRSYYIKNIDIIYRLIEWMEIKRMHPESKYFQKLILNELSTV